MPEGLVKYAETAVFTEETVPRKLTAVHDTKPGVWGKLVVESGALDYVIDGPPPARERIEAGQFGVIEPGVKHHVEMIGPVAFRVEFHKLERDTREP